VTVRLPYANLRACIPALALVSVNATNLFGPPVQLLAIAALLALVWRHLEVEVGFSWLWVGYFLLCIAAGFVAYGADQAVIKAGKLGLFLAASFLTVKGASSDNHFPALLALRAMVGLGFLNLLYALAMGHEVFRADYLIEFSIYSSYTIAMLIYLARPGLTMLDRAAAYFVLVMTGSTMGLLLLILAEVLGRRMRPLTVAGLAAMAPVGLVALHFLMEARGKSLTWDYLATSDRSVLLTTFFETTLPALEGWQWLFGMGVGAPLHHFITADPGFNAYLVRLGEGGVYSFCLHNEALRIFCDFGLLGLLFVAARLVTVCPKPMILLLAIGMLTNSYLYSFSGALLASGLFNPKPPGASHA